MNIEEAIGKLQELRRDLYYRNSNDPFPDAISVVLAELTELRRPDGFWHDDDPDESFATASGLLASASVGAVVKIGQYHHLPYVWAVAYRNDEGDLASQKFGTKEEAKAWKAKHYPEEPTE